MGNFSSLGDRDVPPLPDGEWPRCHPYSCLPSKLPKPWPHIPYTQAPPPPPASEPHNHPAGPTAKQASPLSKFLSSLLSLILITAEQQALEQCDHYKTVGKQTHWQEEESKKQSSEGVHGAAAGHAGGGAGRRRGGGGAGEAEDRDPRRAPPVGPGAHPPPLPQRRRRRRRRRTPLRRPPRPAVRPRLPALPRPRPPAPPPPRGVVGAVHNRAVPGDDGVRQDRGRREEHVRGGEGADGHGAGARRRRRGRGPRGVLRGVAARAGHVARRDGRGRARRRRRLRRPRRVAPHAMARRPRRPRRRRATPPARAPGTGPGDDRVGVLGGRARRREAGGRRGLLRAARRRGPVGAVELERRHGGGDPARHDGLLQPAERPAGAARGLAAHPHPDARRTRHVLGDHRRLPRRRLPRRRRRRRLRGRARRQLGGAPGPVRRRRGRGARGDADGGGVDHRRRRVQRRRPLPRVLYRAGGGQGEPLLRHHLQVMIYLIPKMSK